MEPLIAGLLGGLPLSKAYMEAFFSYEYELNLLMVNAAVTLKLTLTLTLTTDGYCILYIVYCY